MRQSRRPWTIWTNHNNAISLGAKAVGVGRFYLFPLAVAGQAGVERASGLMRAEIEWGTKLMGCTPIGQLSRDNLRFG